MGSFKLGKMTLKSLFGTPETTLYPFQTKPQPKGLKGHVVIDIEDCISCGICSKRCPSGAITVDKAAGTWTINRFRCVQCGTCVRECPKHCLTMNPDYWKPATEKTLDVFSKSEVAQAAKSEA